MKRTFVVSRQGSIMVISLNADLGSLECEAISNDTSEVIQTIRQAESPAVIVDLRQVDYFGSAMLESLLGIWRAVRDRSGQMAMCGVSRVGRELLTVAHFEKLWPICDTLEQAEQQLRLATDGSDVT